MAVRVDVDFKINKADQAKLLAAYKRVGEVAGQKELARIAEDSMDPMLAAVKAKTPLGPSHTTKKGVRRGGSLRRGNISQKWSGFRSRVVWEVANSAPHAHLVEYGHRQVAGGRVGKGGRVIGSVPPHPFMRPAVDATKDIVQRKVEVGIRRFVERAFSR